MGELKTIPVYVAGNTRNYFNEWQKITNDFFVLRCIKGVEIEFDDLPCQQKLPRSLTFSKTENEAMNFELDLFQQKHIIEKCEHSPGEFISNIFPRPKPNNRQRIILDLSELNKEVTYNHFKMNTIQTAATLMLKDCYMGSIDLRDAYYSINVSPPFRKYLRFYWKGQLYQYTCLPNGLSLAPRYFTKILKPIFAKLQEQGITAFGYIDDTWVTAQSYEACKTGIQVMKKLFQNLGFYVHEEKSVFDPSQKLEFLGFVLDSQKMQIYPTQEKIQKVESLSRTLLQKKKYKIRTVAKLIGNYVANTVGCEYGSNHYRYLELDKINALAMNRGDYDQKMNISDKARDEIRWWLNNISRSVRNIRITAPKIVMKSDASNTGWGVFCETISTQGGWDNHEQLLSINAREMAACKYGLQSIFGARKNLVINCQIDNTTAVVYINKHGGTKSRECLAQAKEIWDFCEMRKIWIEASYLPGVLNVEADTLSRKFAEHAEWSLSEEGFNHISQWYKPNFDLFATRMNKKCTSFASWKPDPEAKVVDAFTVSWKNKRIYAFPPFSIISRVAQKAHADKAKGLIVTPAWHAQPWMGFLKSVCRDRMDLGMQVLQNDITKKLWELHLLVWLI